VYQNRFVNLPDADDLPASPKVSPTVWDVAMNIR
jgi:hypothetical protein